MQEQSFSLIFYGILGEFVGKDIATVATCITPQKPYVCALKHACSHPCMQEFLGMLCA